jgi:drug/metabolite transporter (DMT)-like permease
MLLGLGVFAGVGQMALTQAYKMANPGDVGIIQYLGIIFSALLGTSFCRKN